MDYFGDGLSKEDRIDREKDINNIAVTICKSVDIDLDDALKIAVGIYEEGYRK